MKYTTTSIILIPISTKEALSLLQKLKPLTIHTIRKIKRALTLNKPWGKKNPKEKIKELPVRGRGRGSEGLPNASISGRLWSPLKVATSWGQLGLVHVGVHQ